MSKKSLTTVILVCLSFCTLLIAEDKAKTSKARGKDKKDELTLEKIFPEKIQGAPARVGPVDIRCGQSRGSPGDVGLGHVSVSAKHA